MSILNDNKRNGFSFSNLLVLFCAAYRGVFNGWIVHPCAWTCILFSICILHKKYDNTLISYRSTFFSWCSWNIIWTTDSKPKGKNKVYRCTCARTGAPYRLPGMAWLASYLFGFLQVIMLLTCRSLLPTTTTKKRYRQGLVPGGHCTQIYLGQFVFNC